LTDLPDALAVFSGENSVEYPVQEDDGAYPAVRPSVCLVGPRGGRGELII